MKLVTAYINNLRVHWAVEELEGAGISEILVTELFRKTSTVARLEFFCDDRLVGPVTRIIQTVGTDGDTDLFVEVTDAPASAHTLEVRGRFSDQSHTREK